tara:strand:+ start:246 stop:542 length:297 start_codon:yes stop_codon:yes gene_type:complete
MESFLLIIVVKIFIIALGNFLLHKLLNRERTVLILILFWVISFFLNFYQPFTIYDGILQNFFVDSKNILRTSESLGSFSVLLSILTFFIFSLILLKKR